MQYDESFISELLTTKLIKLQHKYNHFLEIFINKSQSLSSFLSDYSKTDNPF